MSKKYRYSLDITNVDEQRVLQATLAHPNTIAMAQSEKDFLRDDGTIDLEHCFLILADSGFVEGCTSMGTFSEVT